MPLRISQRILWQRYSLQQSLPPDGTAHQQEDISGSKHGEMKAGLKLVNPELTPAATQVQLAEERSNSAPGTPPAEESRWPSSASMQGTMDGWQEELPLPHRQPGQLRIAFSQKSCRGLG